MIYLDAIWSVPRSVKVSGKRQRVPFGVDLPSRFCEFLIQWIADSGEEWTAGKLKQLSLWAIHILAGNQDFSVPWFRKIRYKGFQIPKLELFKFLVKHRREPVKVRLVMTLLKSYRLKTWGRPSLESVKDPEPSKPADHYVRLLTKYVDLPRVPAFVLDTTEAINTRKSYADDLGHTHPGPYGLKDFDFPAEIRFLFEDQNEDPWILGKLVPIPDKGKWRVILVGHWAIQLQTKKLADWLREWLWKQREIASGEQSKMSQFIITGLETGRYMMSIDLSQATDRLSRDAQIKLLTSMGVPKDFFNFLSLPAVYNPKDFGEEKPGLAEVRYSNGQPMGLFLSFPMFELLHYVILKFVTATTNADFIICGDDVVIACDEKDSRDLYFRYQNIIERFGGVISDTKTIQSNEFAEGVGAIFLKGYPKELRIPSGKLSTLEAASPGFWLHNSIKSCDPIGRAIHHSWLSTKEKVRYTYDNRRSVNEEIMLLSLEDWHIDSLRSLATHEDYPNEWYSWEDAPPGTRMNNPLFPEEQDLPEVYPLLPKGEKAPTFRFLSLAKYRDDLVNHKIISLYKKEKGTVNENPEN